MFDGAKTVDVMEEAQKQYTSKAKFFRRLKQFFGTFEARAACQVVMVEHEPPVSMKENTTRRQLCARVGEYK